MKYQAVVALLTALILPSVAFAENKPAGTPALPYWGYDGATGPARWAQLDKRFHACARGRNQSPIDILPPKADAPTLGPIRFDYQPTALRVINNGHTIQVNVDSGSTIRADDQAYVLSQLHFHHPSEEKIDGKSYPMVMHMVHVSASGGYAVVAVLLKEGAENPAIQKIWDQLSAASAKELVLTDVSFNPNDLLPVDRRYYSYIGSLTTPPCSEGVMWYVLQTPVGISRTQIARFGALYPDNARPSQRSNNRKVQAGG